MTRAEVQHVDAIESAEHNLVVMAYQLSRRDRSLHLVVDSVKGLMYLGRDGAVLREMQVRLSPEVTVGDKPETVCLAPPRGRRLVARVVDDTYRWAVPQCALDRLGQSVPGDRVIRGALGPLAIILDCGAVIYTQPAAGPLSDPNYVLPGSVRAEAADMEAIKANLQPGMAVYFL
jgi:hypothetical protein